MKVLVLIAIFTVNYSLAADTVRKAFTVKDATNKYLNHTKKQESEKQRSYERKPAVKAGYILNRKSELYLGALGDSSFTGVLGPLKNSITFSERWEKEIEVIEKDNPSYHSLKKEMLLPLATRSYCKKKNGRGCLLYKTNTTSYEKYWDKGTSKYLCNKIFEEITFKLCTAGVWGDKCKDVGSREIKCARIKPLLPNLKFENGSDSLFLFYWKNHPSIKIDYVQISNDKGALKYDVPKWKR